LLGYSPIPMNPQLPMPSAEAQQLIQALDLQAHPEGGFYRETWRSILSIPQSALPQEYDSARSAGTAILFLLPTGHSSRWHRVKSAELWFHQSGDPLELNIAGTAGYSLVACVVVPGFDFADFELID
jgi:uncharacterized protein